MIQVTISAKIPWMKSEANEVQEFKKGTTAEEVFKLLKISKENESNFLIAINGRIEDKSYELQDGDQVSIFPALIGG